MIKTVALISSLTFLAACQNNIQTTKTASTSAVTLTPSAVVANSKNSEWRHLEAENTLYLKLASGGEIIIEMLPDLAPQHVKNTIALVRQGIFDGTNFYRVIDGFVAQGGPLYESEASMPPLEYGSYGVPSELTSMMDLDEDYVGFDNDDGYADETGFYKSFAVGKDLETGESWMLHCYGALGMGRANELDSGGTALYVVNGPAQRYLDRNVTVFGRVIDGMAHIQALKRGQNLEGPVDLAGQNVIESIQIAADIPVAQRTAIEVMDSNTESFKALLKARKNRTGEWFVYQADYMDACGVPIPVRLQQ